MTTAQRRIPGRSKGKGRITSQLDGYQRSRRAWVCLECLLLYFADAGDHKRKADKPICDRVVGRVLVGCGSKAFQHCDSRREAHRLVELARSLRRGDLEDLRCQVPYHLHAVAEDGTRVHVTTYRADFVYRRDGRLIVEDVKPKSALPGGTRDSVQRAAAISALFELKRAIFEAEYGATITLV